MSQRETYVRELGLVELFCRGKSTLDMFRQHNVSIKLNKELSTELIYKILREMFLEHPTLAFNAAYVSSNGIPAFNFIEKVYFKDVLKFNQNVKVDPHDYKSYHDTYRFDVLDPEKPLFQVVLFSSMKEIMLVSDHTLLDGVAGPNFWKIFYKKLSESDAKDEELEKIDYETAVLFEFEKDKDLIDLSFVIAKCEDLYPMTPTTYYKYANWLKSYLPEKLHKYFNTYAPVDPVPGYEPLLGADPKVSRPPTAARLINFTPDEVKVLLKACKAHGVTLTAYLDYCYYYAVYQGNHLTTYQKDKHSLKGCYVVGCRRYLADEQKKNNDCEFGNHYVVGYCNNLYYKDLEQFSWQVVQQMNTEMSTHINDPNYSQSLLDGLEDAIYPERFKVKLNKKINSPRLELFKNSNLGHVDFSHPNSSWVVEDILFFQDQSHINCSSSFSVISSAIGGLNVSLGFIDTGDIVNIDELVTSFKNVILKYAN